MMYERYNVTADEATDTMDVVFDYEEVRMMDGRTMRIPIMRRNPRVGTLSETDAPVFRDIDHIFKHKEKKITDWRGEFE